MKKILIVNTFFSKRSYDMLFQIIGVSFEYYFKTNIKNCINTCKDSIDLR